MEGGHEWTGENKEGVLAPPTLFWGYPRAPQILVKCSTMSLYVSIPEVGKKKKMKKNP